MGDVSIFHDLNDTRAYRNMLLKEGQDKSDLWEFRTLPIVASRKCRLPKKPKTFCIFKEYYPDAYIRIINGLDFLISDRIDAINLSLSPGNGIVLSEDDPLYFAITKCLEKAVIVVVAAGNSGPKNDTMQPLAKIPGVISVGAIGHDNLLLPVSSRGPEGGYGPTVVSYGMPVVTYLKEGYEHPIPMTSYAAPKVTRVAVVILKAMQLLWTSYEKISNSSWDNQTVPLPIPIIGFVDTGTDPRGLPPLPWRVAEALKEGKEFISFVADEQQHLWFRKLHERIKTFPMMGVTTYTLYHALELIAIPLPEYQSHEVGAGLVSLKECRRFLENLTPTRFLNLFKPGYEDAEIALAMTKLDAELGPLWDSNYVNMLLEFLYYGHLQSYAKIV